ncbi:hypothetical protein [Rubrivivax albus]|uniref:Uncharacterized protein n=1 Tax=Rubrivivax albus TaxID=2499835 RepID=A0A437JRU3_9BURK|nr:hypothetical protein [Rubrivivax albus]RVT49668.1 hypothetical protein ENE75_18665 [Rubrivivax albus]
MARPPSSASASEWTTAVEAAVHTELLRRSRLLKWAVALSLLVGALAVWLAIAMRGMTWEEIAPRVVQTAEPLVQQRLAPVIDTQVLQGQTQVDMAQALEQLEADIEALRTEVARHQHRRDPEIAALRQRVVLLERALAAFATAEVPPAAPLPRN